MGEVGCTAFASQKPLRLLQGSLCSCHLKQQAQAWKHNHEQCCSPLSPLGLLWKYSLFPALPFLLLEMRQLRINTLNLGNPKHCGKWFVSQYDLTYPVYLM